MAVPGCSRRAASGCGTPHSAAMSATVRPTHSGCGTLEAICTRPSSMAGSVRIIVLPAV